MRHADHCGLDPHHIQIVHSVECDRCGTTQCTDSPAHTPLGWVTREDPPRIIHLCPHCAAAD
jgi:hypothetical protein